MLALDFDIYLIDEGMPGSTDVEFNRKAGEILRERLETTTIVIVSHDPRTLEKFASSAAVLMAGKLHIFDTLEEAKELMTTKPKVSKFRIRRSPVPAGTAPQADATQDEGAREDRAEAGNTGTANPDIDQIRREG